MYISNENRETQVNNVYQKQTVEKKQQNVSTLKLQKIINKFKSGKKLTIEELEYLKQYAPDIYQKVIAIMHQRETIEQKLKSADTKEEVEQVKSQVMVMEAGCVDKGDDFTKEALTNQLNHAIKETESDKSVPKDLNSEENMEQEKVRTATYSFQGNEREEELYQTENGKKISYGA